MVVLTDKLVQLIILEGAGPIAVPDAGNVPIGIVSIGQCLASVGDSLRQAVTVVARIKISIGRNIFCRCAPGTAGDPAEGIISSGTDIITGGFGGQLPSVLCPNSSRYSARPSKNAWFAFLQ